MKRFLIVLSAFLLCASLIVTSAGCSREDTSRDNEEDEEEASVSEGSDEDVRDTVPIEPDLHGVRKAAFSANSICRRWSLPTDGDLNTEL